MESTPGGLGCEVENIAKDRDTAHPVRQTAEARGGGRMRHDDCCHANGCCNTRDDRIEVKKANGNHTQGIPTEDCPWGTSALNGCYGDTMTIQEIIAKLTHEGGASPHQAMTEAIAQREDVTPELLRLLKDAASHPEATANQADYLGHIFAMYLLAQFREKRAYQPLVNLVTADFRHVDRMLGDVLTEDLGRMLASVCDGDIGLICGIIENVDLNEYVRSAGLDALVVLVAQEAKTREEVMAYFRSLFNGKLEREFNFVWGSLVSKCCRIYPGEVEEDIERAFADGLVDPLFIGLQSVRRDLAKGKDQALERLAENPSYKFIQDTAHEMARWFCFQERQRPAKTSLVEQSGKPAPVRTGPKVGRNEPCPCGSGKKYKKCCGQ